MLDRVAAQRCTVDARILCTLLWREEKKSRATFYLIKCQKKNKVKKNTTTSLQALEKC